MRFDERQWWYIPVSLAIWAGLILGIGLFFEVAGRTLDWLIHFPWW